MMADGVRDALAFFTSTTSCYSGCRQYRENILEAQQQIGTGAPRIHKLRMPFNHPSFIEAAAGQLQVAIDQFDPPLRSAIHVLFSAHSIPKTMADGCQYERQLHESCRLVAESSQVDNWNLVYQSRSGPPRQPWLEPDVCDCFDDLEAKGINQVVIMPIGFVSDHMEVMFDLDIEAREKCAELGIDMVRARTVGTHPKFVSMIRELILERTNGLERKAIGRLPASHDVCPPDCCQQSVAIRQTKPI
jgi:ferrochelatase